MESGKACSDCRGTNVWAYVGAIRQENYCRDCNWYCDCGKIYPKSETETCPACKAEPPTESDAERVKKWMSIIRQTGGSPTVVEHLGRIGPAGRAAVPLLQEIYAKEGKGNWLGAAAYDALRDLNTLKTSAPAHAAPNEVTEPIAPPSPEPVKTPEERLHGAMIYLYVVGGIGAVVYVVLFVCAVLTAVLPGETKPGEKPPNVAVMLLVSIAGLARAGLVLYGAYETQRRASHRAAMLASAAAVIPAGCCFLDVPLGIAALMALSDPEIKPLFEGTDAEAPADAAATKQAEQHPRVRFACPHCEKKLSVLAEVQGKRIKCPRCGKRIEIPGKPA